MKLFCQNNYFFVLFFALFLLYSCEDNSQIESHTNIDVKCSTERVVYVRGTSMLGILNDGDSLTLKENYYNCHPIQLKDIVVFHYNNKKDFIKQVYALAGDKITYQDNYLLVNDKKIKNYKDEFYQVDQIGKSYVRLMQQTIMKNSIIPRGYYLVLGTAKIGGYDFRRIGLVPYKNIVGKIEL